MLFILRTPFILHRSAVDSLVASQMHYCTAILTNAAKISFFKKHMLLSPLSPVCLLAAYRGWPSSAWAVSSSSEPMRRSAALCYSSTTCDCPESWPDGENQNSREIVSGNGGSSILLSPLKWGREETLTGMTALPRVPHSYLLIRHSKHHRIFWNEATLYHLGQCSHCSQQWLGPFMFHVFVREWVMWLKTVFVSFEWGLGLSLTLWNSA